MAVTLARISLKHSDPNAGLSRVFRQVLKDKNIGEQELNGRIVAYLTNTEQTDSKDLEASVNNITKELAQSEMTWKVFTKAMAILGVDEVTMLV